jgi:hypothetical protein
MGSLEVLNSGIHRSASRGTASDATRLRGADEAPVPMQISGAGESRHAWPPAASPNGFKGFSAYHRCDAVGL